MNDRQHEAYSRYLRDLADALLLRDWEIELDRDRADAGAWACVHVLDVENFARVRVDWPAFFHRSPEERREWLTHELVHCHLDRPQRVVGQLAEQFADNTAMAFASEAHEKEIEVCTQRLARILAPLLPLPPETEGA